MTNHSTSIVFASKQVGYGCLKYLSAINENIVQVFVGADDEDIRSLCEENGYDWATCSRDNIANYLASAAPAGWLLNFWSSLILDENTLACADRRLNIHPGLVPHCRGNDSAAWCIRQDIPAGVSLIEMEAVLDAGAIYSQMQVEVKSTDTGKKLHHRQIDACIELFIRDWLKIRAGEIVPHPQPEGGSYFKRKDTNQDRVRKLDDLPTGKALARWIRAHDFSPATCAEVVLPDGNIFEIREKT